MSNAADGYLGDWLPHKEKCGCLDCQLERAQTRIATLTTENAALRGQVARLDWQEITESNLPGSHDEMICIGHQPGDQSHWGEIRAYHFFADPDGPETFESITVYGWTHFRPIGAPYAK